MQSSLWVSLKSISWHSCPQYWAIWQKEQVFNFLFFFFNCSVSSLQLKQNRFSTKLISSLPRINLDRISDYFTIKTKSRKNLKASKTPVDWTGGRDLVNNRAVCWEHFLKNWESAERRQERLYWSLHVFSKKLKRILKFV